MSDPWADLAAKARALASLADQYAAADPVALTPGDTDPLGKLDRAAVELRGLVAACRAEVWRQLRQAGHSAAAIGKMWGVSRQVVTRQIGRGGGAADGCNAV